MKKIYESPNMCVVTLQSSRLLISASDTDINSTDYDYVREFNNNSTISNKSVWDEEW
jgi:hypothetical protein